tara:strand:+ start:480 stop:773 length:294 start_codon:yes stop_codon:yes gene_type:complete
MSFEEVREDVAELREALFSMQFRSLDEVDLEMFGGIENPARAWIADKDDELFLLDGVVLHVIRRHEEEDGHTVERLYDLPEIIAGSSTTKCYVVHRS